MYPCGSKWYHFSPTGSHSPAGYVPFSLKYHQPFSSFCQPAFVSGVGVTSGDGVTSGVGVTDGFSAPCFLSNSFAFSKASLTSASVFALFISAIAFVFSASVSFFNSLTVFTALSFAAANFLASLCSPIVVEPSISAFNCSTSSNVFNFAKSFKTDAFCLGSWNFFSIIDSSSFFASANFLA